MGRWCRAQHRGALLRQGRDKKKPSGMWLQNEVIFFLPAERRVLQESLQTGIPRLLPSGALGGVCSGGLWRKPPRTEIATLLRTITGCSKAFLSRPGTGLMG